MIRCLKILLVDPAGWQGSSVGNKPYPNVGLAYMISALKVRGYDVVLVDMNNNCVAEDQLITIAKQFHPDIVGFSIKTATMKSARASGKFLKEFLPEVSIVVGGAHATLGCISLAQDSWIDRIIYGEGEETFPAFCDDYLEIWKSLDSTSRFVEEPGQGKGALVSNLDKLAFPDYDSFSSNVLDAIRVSYPLVTSRGCPYQCIYCSVPRLCGTKIRMRSPLNVVSEIKAAVAQFGVTGFEIIDDAFNVDIDRCKEICRLLIEERLNLEWSCPNGLRADRVDEELAELMFHSGCRSVMVGIETADPQLLSTVNKGETIEDIAKGIKVFQDEGITVGGYFIIGLPGDSYQSQKRSVKFVQQMQISAHFNMLVPYPGTELWQWLEKNAHVIRDIEDCAHFSSSFQEARPVFETGTLGVNEYKRIYEMVHTRLGYFSLIVPDNLCGFRYYWRVTLLLLKYYPKGLWHRMLHAASDPKSFINIFRAKS